MRLYFNTILLVVLFNLSKMNGQAKYDYNWILGYPPNDSAEYFGGTRLTFLPELASSKYFPTYCFASSASVLSSSSGQLLAYTDGCRILDGENKIMVNGDSIAYGTTWRNYCDDIGYPGTQNTLILPWPGDPQKAIVLYIKDSDDLSTQYLLSSIIEFTDEFPDGIVTKKDHIEFEPGFTAMLTATRHANGRDWWIIIPESNSNIYFVLLFTPSGINKDIQSIGSAWDKYIHQGQALFTPDGSKYIRVNPKKGVDIFNFDRCTGLLSNAIESGPLSNPTLIACGAAASKNSQYLYVGYDTILYQYDLLSNDILKSRIEIGTYDGYLNPFWTTFYHLVLAPNGKIYEFSTNGVKSLHVINYPEVGGAGCEFVQHDLQLPTYADIGGVNVPYYRLGPMDDSFCDTLNINNVPVALFTFDLDSSNAVSFTNLSYFEPDYFYWDFGDQITSNLEHPQGHQYNPGEYVVCLTVANLYGEDTYCRTITIDPLMSISEEIFDLGIQVGPNPIQDKLIIKNENLIELIFTMYSSLGTRIMRNEIHELNIEFDVSSVPQGTYFYIIEANSNLIQNGKLVKINFQH